MSESDWQSGNQIGPRLRAALTDEQLCALLNVAGEAGVLRRLDSALRAADPDLANTVGRILAASESAEPPTTEIKPSDGRALQIWREHWAAWEGHVAELGNDEGDYANDDEHWHPPYFDPSALADDLERVAAKLAPDLDRAFALADEPGLFKDALTKIDDGIASYPDAMNVDEAGCVLGPQATTCALRWTWLDVAAQPAPGAALVERFWKLENGYDHVRCDVEAAARFFSELPETVCREIHAQLREPDIADAVEDIRFVWHRIRQAYEQRFDPDTHLRICDKNLHLDWRYGEPLISAAVARGDAAAETYVARTVSSLLRIGSADEPWQPEQPLWEPKRYARTLEEERTLLDLLGQWESIAEARGNPARAASCRLQLTLWTSADDWPVVFAGFAGFHARGGDAAVGDNLFREWRTWEVDACAPPFGESPAGKQTESWVRGLIDARRDPAFHRSEFFENLEVWLGGCRDHAVFFGRHWRSLALLTRTLPQHERIKSDYPALFSHVLLAADNLPGKLVQSMREALTSLNLDLTQISPMPAWTEHLHTLVPSPANTSSVYRPQANWMKALAEVNPPRYDVLLTRWRTEFRQRRNLWRDMKACGCPGC